MIPTAHDIADTLYELKLGIKKRNLVQTPGKSPEDDGSAGDYVRSPPPN